MKDISNSYMGFNMSGQCSQQTKKCDLSPKTFFFQSFSSDMDLSCHFTLSLNCICENISKIKKFRIYTPNFKIQITVPWAPSAAQRSDLWRWPSYTFLLVTSRSTKWAIYTQFGLRFFFEPIPTPLSFSPISILVVDEGRVWNQIFFKANWIRNKKKIISNPALINNIGGQIMLEILYEPLLALSYTFFHKYRQVLCVFWWSHFALKMLQVFFQMNF